MRRGAKPGKARVAAKRPPATRTSPKDETSGHRELEQHMAESLEREKDPELVKRLGLFDYLRERLAIAGTPDDCVAQVRAAEAAGATQLMFTVSLAADPVRTVELFGREVLPALTRADK